MKQLASGVTVKAGGKPLAGLTQCDLSLTTVFASSQTKEDKGPQDEAERVDWELSVQGEFGRESASSVSGGDVRGMLVQGSRVSAEYVIGELASYQGFALVSSYSQSEPVEGKITYSATLKGVGKLVKFVKPVSEEE